MAKFDIKLGFDTARKGLARFLPTITVAFNHAHHPEYHQAVIQGLSVEQAQRWGMGVSEDLAGAVKRLRAGGATTEDYRIDRMLIFTDGYENNGHEAKDRAVAMFTSAEYLADDSAGFTDLMKLVHMGLSSQIEPNQAMEIHLCEVEQHEDYQEVSVLACSNKLMHEEADVTRAAYELDADIHELFDQEDGKHGN